VSPAPDDLDTGLDAGLETYPRYEITILAAAPYLMTILGGNTVFMILLTALPAVVVAYWTGRSRRP
jgi:hypothetical protein